MLLCYYLYLILEHVKLIRNVCCFQYLLTEYDGLILQNIHGDCSKNTDTKELEEWNKYKKIIPYFLSILYNLIKRAC